MQHSLTHLRLFLREVVDFHRPGNQKHIKPLKIKTKSTPDGDSFTYRIVDPFSWVRWLNNTCRSILAKTLPA
jgi:hypothetical protein